MCARARAHSPTSVNGALPPPPHPLPEVHDGKLLKTVDAEFKYRERAFAFDRVYSGGASQADLFSDSVRPVVDEVLDGYSCTVFAYGQTGAWRGVRG